MQPDVNSTTEAENKSSVFFDYIGLETLNTLYNKISTYAKNDFAKFSAIFVAITTIGVWLIRACGYVYQSGKLSIYNINKSYISVDQNFFLQIIEVIAAEIFLIAVNYIYFYIATKEDNTKFHVKRKLRKLFLYTIEIIFILAYVILQNNYNLKSFIKEIQDYSRLTCVSLIAMLLILALFINNLGIQVVIYSKYKASRNNTKNSSENKTLTRKYNLHFILISGMIVILSIFLILLYIFGIFQEHQRTSYKIIKEQTATLINNDTDFILQDNTVYHLYAVVFENEDVYILCQLLKSDNEISIDTNYQRIISKDNIVTCNVSNIYRIQYTN